MTLEMMDYKTQNNCEDYFYSFIFKNFFKNKLTEKSEKYQKILIASLERKIPSKKFV